ncbi:diguanylate cyclase domain-containing protein [Thiospirochaeta perfilievii]|nr:diguanylate cyclase [Thiospirochaeta perfilievii]
MYFRNTFFSKNLDYNVQLKCENYKNWNFTPNSGKNAAKYFLSNKLPQAIICLNDDMAIGAIEVFKSSGLVIPGDIAVTGFDGSNLSNYLFPSLTTIEQPLESITVNGLEKLLSIINGFKVEEKLSNDCTFITRQSCGCLSPQRHNFRNRSFSQNSIEDHYHYLNSIIEGEEDKSSLHNMFIEQLNKERIKKELLKDIYFIDCLASRQIEYNKSHNYLVDQWKLRTISNKISGRIYFRDILNEILDSLAQLDINYFKLYLIQEEVIYNNTLNLEDFTINLHLHYQDGSKVINSVEGIKKGTSDLFKSDDSVLVSTLNWNNIILGFFEICFIDMAENTYDILGDVISNSIYTSKIHLQMQDSQRKLEMSLAETRCLNEKLKTLSIRDEMTGLLNRRGFFELSETLLEEAKDNSLYQIFFIDMDGLKSINDNYGHDFGDTAIIELANTLKKCFRSNDVVARLGGDEFTVLIKSDDNYDFDHFKERLKLELNKLNITRKYRFKISASIGTTSFNKSSKSDLYKLLKEADNELYRVKKDKFREP